MLARSIGNARPRQLPRAGQNDGSAAALGSRHSCGRAAQRPIAARPSRHDRCHHGNPVRCSACSDESNAARTPATRASSASTRPASPARRGCCPWIPPSPGGRDHRRGGAGGSMLARPQRASWRRDPGRGVRTISSASACIGPREHLIRHGEDRRHHRGRSNGTVMRTSQPSTPPLLDRRARPPPPSHDGWHRSARSVARGAPRASLDPIGQPEQPDDHPHRYDRHHDCHQLVMSISSCDCVAQALSPHPAGHRRRSRVHGVRHRQAGAVKAWRG